MKKIIGIILLCLVHLNGVAQEQYKFRLIDVVDGLSDNQIRGLSVTPDGRIGIRTASILNIYDGASFEHFPYDKDKKYVWTYTRPPKEYYDGQGRVWMKELNYLLLLDLKTNTFNYDIPDELAKMGVDKRLKNLFIDEAKNYWFVTEDNTFRYYSPEMGIYISSDPIGLAGGFNTYAYVKDTNTWVDVLGLSGELVYQLIRDNKVVYYGITSRTALERMAEHGKTKVFDNMEILADGLTHDQARSIEGALIRQRLKERADDWSDFDSIKARLDKSGLDNRNRGRIKERWTSENPLDDLRDKIYKKPKKVKVGCKS